jgi:hypothetical protein
VQVNARSALLFGASTPAARTLIVDQQRVGISSHGWIGGLETMASKGSSSCAWIGEVSSVGNIKLIIIDIVQEHIDAAQL